MVLFSRAAYVTDAARLRLYGLEKGRWMPSIYELKPAFQARLRPLVIRLARSGVTPNQVTAFALLLSLVGGLLIYLMPQARWPLLLLPVILFVRMALNAIDGMLAREHDMQTDLGAMFNELSDVVADALLYLPLAYVVSFSPLGVVVVVMLGVVGEMAGVVAQTVGASRRYDGPLGKSDRAFLFGALSVWVALFGGPYGFVALCLGIAGVLGLLTIGNRVRSGLAESRA